MGDQSEKILEKGSFKGICKGSYKGLGVLDPGEGFETRAFQHSHSDALASF